MANKSGKAKSKTRYTNVDKIIEEIDCDSETDLLLEDSDSASDHSYDSKMEAYFLNGEDTVLDW